MTSNERSRRISLAIADTDAPGRPLDAFLIYGPSACDKPLRRSVSVLDMGRCVCDSGGSSPAAAGASPAAVDTGATLPLKRHFSVCDLDSLDGPVSPVEKNQQHHPRRNSVALRFHEPRLVDSR